MAELSREKAAEGIEIWTLLGESRRNTLTRALVDELLAALEEVDRSREPRVVILTGQGEKAFCAGADLKERSGLTPPEVQRWLDDLRRLMDGIEASRPVFLAALNGSAFGGGTELALACDLRIAVESAELALTEVTLAIVPGAGGTQRLPRLIGLGFAEELILTGRRVSSSEALKLGLINRVAPAGGVLPLALELAQTIAQNGPLAVAAAKNALRQGLSLPLSEGLTLERQAYEKTLHSRDRLEGLAAFREKRRPIYRGE